MVYKMDADSMINAMVRFSARRPGVEKMFSDRGSNFVATKSILRKELKELNETTAPELMKRGIEWSFIPAYTPHYGGAWERMVGLFKKHLATVGSGDPMHVDTFNTVIIEIESILNRRPLTILSQDSRDLEPLTPAHILYPAKLQGSAPSVVPTDGEVRSNLNKAWRRAQSKVNEFWKAWRTEYLSLLHDRKKWKGTKKNLEKDDIVIIVDESVSRHDWKLARVVNVVDTGPHVRKVNVRRADGKIVLKDRTKLVKMELDDK